MIELSENLFDECVMPEKHFEILKELAMNENWNYIKDESKFKNPILRNYLIFTYKRLVELQKLNPNKTYFFISNEYLSFNTGLQTNNYEEIYMLLGKNQLENKKNWYSIGFFKESDNEFLSKCKLSERAQFINSTDELILDSKLKIITNLDHILNEKENLERIPKDIRNTPYLINILNGAIDISLKRLRANYKFAVPHYYNNKIQLLLPIFLKNESKQPDVVLVLEKKNDCYRGSTCLTLDMAYNNARLIAKPETDWIAR